MTAAATLDPWTLAVAPPRERRNVIELARSLTVGDGPLGPRDGKPGKLLPVDTHPPVAAILRAIGLRRKVVIAGPVQDGKTYAGVVATLVHQIVEDRRAVVLAAPRFEDAAAVWTAKVRGTLIASGYAEVLPQEGAGARQGVPDEQLLATGCRVYLRGMGGANEAQQAAITARAVVVTEVDSIALGTRYAKRQAQQEGRRKLALIERRALSFKPDERVVLESTVKDDRASLILTLWEESTGGRMWHECPHCGGWHPREWEQVTYDPTDSTTAEATARIACPGCGVQLTPIEATASAARAIDVHRGQRIEGGVVVGPMPAASAWGLRYSSLDSPLPSKALGLLCAEHRDAVHALRERGDVAPLRQFVRDHLTRGFRPEEHGADELTARTVAPSGLAARSAAADYDRGVVPFGTVAVGIDMQEREAWWVALALDGDRAAFVDWSVEYLCHRHEAPTPAQRAAVLDRILAKATAGWPTPDGRIVTAAALGVDVGGRGWLDQVDAWLRAQRWRAWAMRGDPRPERGDGAGRTRLPGWCETFRRDDGRRLMLADPACKARLIDGLAAPPSSPIAVLLPRQVAGDDHLLRHLTAEERVDEGKGPVWVKRSKNDLFDAGTYALALARFAAARQAAAPSDPITIGA
jgi:phage terminase large subunit GpA-like protein